jgi:hypothetical protein
MLGGIVFQLCALPSFLFLSRRTSTETKQKKKSGVIIGFALLAIEYLVRYSLERPLANKAGFARGPLEKKLRLMVIAVLFNVTCLFIRCAPSFVFAACSYSLTHACVSGPYTGRLSWRMVGMGGSYPLKSISVRKKNPFHLQTRR